MMPNAAGTHTEIAPCPPPVDARVRCGAALHRLRWEAGQIHALDHGPGDLGFRHALDAPCRCATVLEAIRRKQGPAGVPSALWQARHAYSQHREALGHGHGWDAKRDWGPVQKDWLDRALRRRHAPLVQALETRGVRMNLEGAFTPAHRPEAAVLTGHDILGHPVVIALCRAHRWLLDLDALLTAGQATSACGDADPLWGEPINYCRVCQHHYSTSRLYPGGIIRHAQTERHAVALRAAALAAFEAAAPALVLRAQLTYRAQDVQRALARHAIEGGPA
jgi:hypothetical protein